MHVRICGGPGWGTTQVEGVDFAALFNRLPKTRAATGDDALRQVLELARQQPPPEPSPV